MDGAYASDCQRCERLVKFLAQVKQQQPDYFCRPVPSFGDASARLLVVGLAPGMHGANATGRPFTGDHAGILLYQTLYDHGFATAPVSVAARDELRLLDCRICNAVKCLPPQNKPLGSEINNCRDFLALELAAQPPGGVIVALGTLAHRSVVAALGARQKAHPFGHGREHALGGQTVLDSYHCSRYNTQTRRLTPGMFAAVFARARQLLHA